MCKKCSSVFDQPEQQLAQAYCMSVTELRNLTDVTTSVGLATLIC